MKFSNRLSMQMSLPKSNEGQWKGIGSLSRAFHFGLPRRTADEIPRSPVDIHLLIAHAIAYTTFASHVGQNELKL
jgi:hypothetical protein